MQNQTTNNFSHDSNGTGMIPVRKNAPKKRGRKPLPFIAKPTPSQLVLTQLNGSSPLSFFVLQKATGLTEDKLEKALVSLVLNSREVTSFIRDDTRYYYVRRNQQ